MSVANRGSIYDKVIDEKWFNTPDMGEYWNNAIYKKNADTQSEIKGKTEFFVENPPTENCGYHDDLGVVAIKVNPVDVYKKYMEGYNFENNVFDGDTILFKLTDVQDTTKKFQVYYSDTVFQGVRHYLKETLGLTEEENMMKLRFVAINAPEVTHYSNYIGDINGNDVYEVNFNQFLNNNTYIATSNGQFNKDQFYYRNYTTDSSNAYIERNKNDVIKFLRIKSQKNGGEDEFHEIMSTKKEEEKNRVIRRCVVTCQSKKSLEYHKKSKVAQQTVMDCFKSAEDAIFLLDTVGLNGKKSDIPYSYKKSFEKSTNNPFYSLYDMWQSAKDEKAAYQYAAYRTPGQEANGRFLAAIYLKINGQWINLNKKLLYESEKNGVERANYTDSVDDMVNDYYQARGLKLWTYDLKNQLYIDSISDDVYKSKDDRKEIQQKIAGCDLKEMRSHTVMIGDVLFMIPPTSIRTVSQVRTSKTHLLRAKGGMSNTLPKTERLIQMELFFNEDGGINGIPYTQKLPNGNEKKYYMNGLRALIAQFKLAPIQPIHNSFINDTLNINAVALSSYTIDTIPNYPRTLKATITLEEFDWIQYMPCQAIPQNQTSDDLYKNGFSETMHFPLMRYHYQKALERGNDLKLGDFKNVAPNNKDYIKQTIGNKTALQPMDFSDCLVDFYIPDQKLLAARKQAVIEMKTKPLGQVFNFSKLENKWISKTFFLNKFTNDIKALCDRYIPKLTDKPDDENNIYLSVKVSNDIKPYSEIIKGNTSMTYTGPNANHKVAKEEDMIKTYVQPLQGEAIDAYKKYNVDIGEMITNYELRTRTTLANSKTYYFDLIYTISFNRRFFEEDDSLDKIRRYCAKQLNLEAKDIFPDDTMTLCYRAEFNLKELSKPFQLLDSDKEGASYKALSYLSALTDSQQQGFEDFDMNKEMEDLKNSIDQENEKSIKFDLFDMGTPIVSSISCTYNNIFTKTSLKAVDGQAGQYCGGTDSSLQIEIIGDEYVVGQAYALNRLCVKYLIDYRKIMKSSPLRIDSDFTRLLGIYEVIIDSIDVSNIPDTTDRFKIILNLSSVDRTLRNKESLKRIKDIDNATVQQDELLNTKGYFDLKNTLGKAELYPDLELPTMEQLEKDGFFFMQNKYQPERIYPDPDFYFLYWYPTLANNIKTSLVEFFTDPDNFKYEIADDFSNDTFTLEMNMKDGSGKSVYKVLGWDKRDMTYSERVKTLQELAKELVKDEDGNKLTDDQSEKFAESVTATMQKNEEVNGQLKALQEVLDNSVYNCYQINTMTCVNVKDVDVVDTLNDKEKEKKKSINDKLKEIIKEELVNPCFGEVEEKGKDNNDFLFFKPHTNKTFKSPLYNNSWGGMKSDSSVVKIFSTIMQTDVSINDLKEQISYIKEIVLAGGVGAMASTGVFNTDEDLVNKGYSKSYWHNAVTNDSETEEPLCYPPRFSRVTNKKGEKENVPICLYPNEKTSELLTAHDEETRQKGVLFGRFGIKRYSGSQLATMFKFTIPPKDGFLDPFYNNDICEMILGYRINEDEEKERISYYIDRVCRDNTFAFNAFYRQMLVWLWILIEQDALVNVAHLYCGELMAIAENRKSDDDNSRLANIIYHPTYGLMNYISEGASKIGQAITDTITNWRTKDKDGFDQLVGENGTYEKIKDSTEKTEEKVKKLEELIKKNSKDYSKRLITGLFYTLGAISMSGFDSSILRAVCNGNMQEYSSCISEGLGEFDYADLTEEEKRISRYAQFLNYFFEEDRRNIQNPLQSYGYNNKVQRAYLKAADDPKVYMLHSFYDMVMNDKRGSMARAFPTYYMLLVDEGRRIGYWKLQDNFYDMNSIIEFEVVKSRKIVADTAKIVMTNMYGTFNTDDSDMKDEYEYTMADVFNSIFSPRPYFQKEYMRRKNARDVNSAKMQPGARVHLRMGYGSNAASLPIVFNGCVTEFEAGETMTLICQGDGIELANPNMFNSLDAKDVQDLAASDKFFGLKQIIETWSNLSTPRDMLVLPLVVEGTWIQELVKKYSSGRFFNSNPFGIVHFGDRKYNAIFTTNGEVEQNIYEGLSRPTWNYEASGITDLDALNGIESEYSLSEAPRVRVSLSNGTSYWDIMNIAASLSPDFICSTAPFQMRSTIFHGAPRFYYAYDYMEVNGQVVEKRKPFQQYHIYSSYSDIIDNKITTSQKDIRTNAVGHYIGPGWVKKQAKTVGPLFVDFDIFPENQQSTTVNLNFEYKNNDIVPFNVPIVDKVVDTFDWTDGPDGELTAWRATASALKNCMKEMYKGELIILGDPTVKPYDRVTLQDVYEDIGGSFEVEQVVHMFSNDIGFTTSIKPDLISAIDNKYETRNNAIVTQSLLPAFITTLSLVLTNLDFHDKNRPMYLAIAKAAKKGNAAVSKAVRSAVSAVGKGDMQRDAKLINNNIDSKILKDFLQIDDAHISLANKIDDLVSASKIISGKEITGSKSLIKVINQLEKSGDMFDSLTPEALNELEEMLKSDKFKSTKALDMFDKGELLNSIKEAKGHLVLSKDELSSMKKSLSKLAESNADVKKLYDMIDASKDLDMLSKKGKSFLGAFKDIAKSVDDFSTSSELMEAVGILNKKSSGIYKSLGAVRSLDDLGKIALTARSAFSIVSTLATSTILFCVDLYLTKSCQEFITRKLRNLQVLTLYPLKKDGVVWTAGINGHQGSVVGSPAYDEPGWLESMAIKFFDYGNTEEWYSPKRWLGFIRDALLTTDEMKQIVDGYKRGNNFTVEGQSKDKQRTDAFVSIMDELARSDVKGYADYKKVYMFDRISMKDISQRNITANQAYAFYKMQNIDDIERSLAISKNLVYVLSGKDDDVVQKLYKNKCFILANDYNSNNIGKDFKNAKLEQKHILRDNGNDKEADLVYVKKLENTNPPIYDIPYLRPDANIILKQVCEKIMKEIQPNYKDKDCDFDKMKEHPIIFHSGTMINSSSGWRSTGYLFSIEVKNYDKFSNIIKDIEKDRDEIAKTCDREIPFTISKDDSSKFGANTYSIFVHCPKI